LTLPHALRSTEERATGALAALTLHDVESPNQDGGADGDDADDDVPGGVEGAEIFSLFGVFVLVFFVFAVLAMGEFVFRLGVQGSLLGFGSRDA